MPVLCIWSARPLQRHDVIEFAIVGVASVDYCTKPRARFFKPSIDIENPAVLSATVPLTLTFEGVLMRPAQ